jgi:hypothetical protein
MSMFNVFTKHPVPKKIAELFTVPTPPKGETITLTPDDHAWYNYAVLEEQIPMTPETEYNKADIVGEGFYRITLDAGEGVEEVAFLDTMGLLVKRGDTDVYISPLAEVLYGPTGPFQAGPTSIAAIKTDLTPVANFMRRYALPGRMWRAFLARGQLPPTIEMATTLDAEMAGMSKMMAELGAATKK